MKIYIIGMINKIILAGIDQSQTSNEVRCIVLVNILSSILSFFTLTLMCILIPFYSQIAMFQIIGFTFAIILLGAILLNHLKLYLLSRLYFGYLPLIFLTVSPILIGLDSNMHIYLLCSFFIIFFIYPNNQKLYMYQMFFLFSISYIGIEIWFYKNPPVIDIDPNVIHLIRYVNDFGLIMYLLIISAYTYTVIRNTEMKLVEERQKSENLLLNILPKTIAKQLKSNPTKIATRFDDSSILFADIVNFTVIAQKVSANELVEMLDEIFLEFDKLTDKYELEKIKTIGDAYMVAGGLPDYHKNHLENLVEMALSMMLAVKNKFSTKYGINLRIGIHTGPVVAGVIGRKKFIYDLWGDSVNIASRMESHGLEGEIQVTQDVYVILKNKYLFEPRGKVNIKGKGKINTYLLRGQNDKLLICCKKQKLR
jgi:adenylate cyclase